MRDLGYSYSSNVPIVYSPDPFNVLAMNRYRSVRIYEVRKNRRSLPVFYSIHLTLAESE